MYSFHRLAVLASRYSIPDLLHPHPVLPLEPGSRQIEPDCPLRTALNYSPFHPWTRVEHGREDVSYICPIARARSSSSLE